MRTKYTIGSIIGNRELLKIVGKSTNGAKIWSWKCSFCGTVGRPMNTSMLARCKRLDSVPVCCNTGKLNKHYTGGEYLSQDYITRIRRMAKAAGREFEVDIEYLETLLIDQKFKCALSGVQLPPRIGREKNGASLDRIDSSKGYISGNVQWVYTKINSMKSDLDQEEFISLCKLVAENS